MFKVPLLHIGVALIVDVVKRSAARNEVGGIVVDVQSSRSHLVDTFPFWPQIFFFYRAEVRHTGVKMVEGTFCGGGLTCLRADIAEAIKQAMAAVTAGRKNPFKLAGILGLKTLFYLLIGKLTIPMAEEAAARLLKLPCCGIVSPYAETAYNIDDAESLEQARQRLTNSH